MKKLIICFFAFVIICCLGFFIVTSPWLWSLTHLNRDVADTSASDLDNGRVMFEAGDCATCHSTPNQADPLKLGGGRSLDTAFGRFYMPNISPDINDGIGSWTIAEFTRAVREGVGPGGLLPDGRNLYPAFPYTSYQRMTANDVRDLFAYIKTLKPVQGKAPDHKLKFPFNMRRGIGLWRLAFLDGKPLSQIANEPALVERGRYLVEGPAHCAECHSPRNFMGVIKSGMRFSGGSTPNNIGYFPNITQDDTGIGYWAENSIFNYLLTGKSPVNKIAGGDMAEVIKNTSHLPRQDLQAMAAYLKTIPGVDHPAPGQPQPNHTSKIELLKNTTKRVVVLPTSPIAQIDNAKKLYVVSTKTFSIDKAKIDEEDGKLLATAQLTLLEHQGDLIKARLEGWQMDGAPSVLYALPGQRIMFAVFSDKAIGAYHRGDGVKDTETDQIWYPVSIDFWTKAEGLNIGREPMWAYASDLFSSTCSVCHSLPQSDQILANNWIGNLNAMKRYTSLTPDQYRLLLGYLQYHSKDVNEETANKGNK